MSPARGATRAKSGTLIGQLRIALVIAAGLAATAIAGAWFMVMAYEEHGERLHQAQLTSVVTLSEAQVAFWRLRLGLRQFSAEGPDRRRRLLEEQEDGHRLIEDRLAAYAAVVSSADEQQALAALRVLYGRYQDAWPKFVELWQSAGPIEALAWESVALTPAADQVARAFARQIAMQQFQEHIGRLEAERHGRLAFAGVAVLSLLIVGMVLAGYLRARRILRSVHELRDEALRVLREQLGESVEQGEIGNELTALQQSIRLMSARLLARTQALEHAQARLRGLLAASPAVIYAAHAHGDYGATFVSDNIEAQLGYKPGDFLGDSGFWTNGIHPEDRDRVLGHMQRLFTDGRIRAEYRFRHKDGSWRWMDDVTILVRNAAGEAQELVGSWFDVTERRHAEDALRESEARLRQVLGSTPAVIWSSRAEGEYARTYVSENVRRVFGYAAEEFLEDPRFWADRIHPEDRPAVLARLPGETEANAFAHEYRFRHADGSWRWVRADASVLRDAAGRPRQIMGYWIDVTDRKMAELSLADSQRRQAALLNGIPDIAWLKDGKGRFIAVNEPFARACGRRSEELPGLTDLDVWPAELAERYRADDAEVMRTAQSKRAEEPLQGADGACTWIETVKVPIFSREGQVGGTAGIARDITERKTMAQALERSQERLRLALDASGAALWDADLASGEVFLSEGWAQMIGAPAGETRTTVQELFALAHPQEQQKLLEAIVPVLKGECAAYRQEHRVRGAKGGWRWVLSIGKVTARAADGRATRVTGVNFDMTERRQMEQKLRDSEARHRLLFESSRDAIMTLEPPSWRFTSANPATLALFGAKDEGEFLALGPAALSPERQPDGRASGGKALAMIEHAMREGSHFFEWTHRRLDGTDFPATVLLARLEQGGHAFLEATVRDISDQRRLEQAIQETLQAKTEFMASVTHELRTPLNVVIGYSGLLADRVPGPLNDKQAVYVDDIRESGQRLLALVEGILEMSRLDTPGFVLDPEPLELADVLCERITVHRRSAQARRLSIGFEAAADLGRARLDPRVLQRILNALLDNAIKFNREGGNVTVRARRIGGTLEVAVADTGIGIAARDLPRLFQPLVQLEPGTARRHGGIGLGLALARGLAVLQGGTLEVESEPGKGSTFTLRLPVGGEA